jgi:hypothetical protein
MVEATFDSCRDALEGVGEGIWLKSKKESVSGSRHWLVKDGGMFITGRIAVAIGSDYRRERE